MKTALRISSGILGAAVLFSSEPDAYVVSGPRWTQAQASYVVNAANLDVPAAQAIAGLQVGADAWFGQSGGAFQFVYAGPSAQTTNTNDGINLVLFRNASSGSAIATTYWWYSGSRILDADIVFWDAAFQFFTGSSGCAGGFYVEDIAAHEFGHALGLGHSTSNLATMYPSTSACNTRNRSLDADDIAGVRALYPLVTPPPTAPTGLRIVLPSS